MKIHARLFSKTGNKMSMRKNLFYITVLEKSNVIRERGAKIKMSKMNLTD